MSYDRRRQLHLRRFGSIMGILAVASSIEWSTLTPVQAQSTALPPPPPLGMPSTELPPAESPQPLPSVNLSPAPVSLPSSSFKGYRVYVNGDSPLLLQQVRTIEPGAFLQNYQGRRVIQVGLFGNAINARQKVATLASQGIRAEISDELVGAPLSNSPQAKGYYVVLPASRADLPQIREQAIRMGVPQHLISLRDRPLGTHVAVGPFSKKQDAEEVEQYLKNKGGLDARVYFDR